MSIWRAALPRLSALLSRCKDGMDLTVQSYKTRVSLLSFYSKVGCKVSKVASLYWYTRIFSRINLTTNRFGGQTGSFSVLDLICRGAGLTPSVASQHPKFSLTPHWFSQKYIADPPLVLPQIEYQVPFFMKMLSSSSSSFILKKSLSLLLSWSWTFAPG